MEGPLWARSVEIPGDDSFLKKLDQSWFWSRCCIPLCHSKLNIFNVMEGSLNHDGWLWLYFVQSHKICKAEKYWCDNTHACKYRCDNFHASSVIFLLKFLPFLPAPLLLLYGLWSLWQSRRMSLSRLFSDIKITIWVASGKPNIDHLILKDLRLDTENNRKVQNRFWVCKPCSSSQLQSMVVLS